MSLCVCSAGVLDQACRLHGDDGEEGLPVGCVGIANSLPVCANRLARSGVRRRGTKEGEGGEAPSADHALRLVELAAALGEDLALAVATGLRAREAALPRNGDTRRGLVGCQQRGCIDGKGGDGGGQYKGGDESGAGDGCHYCYPSAGDRVFGLWLRWFFVRDYGEGTHQAKHSAEKKLGVVEMQGGVVSSCAVAVM